ncbi:hypothetical protein GCM10023335_44850 [Streptomyces siamensis]|uniref:Transposase n=1 Tax=Streptomyces siamensis TaxID=1274986 RepID=A0ABP9J3E9_9ACTN
MKVNPKHGTDQAGWLLGLLREVPALRRAYHGGSFRSEHWTQSPRLRGSVPGRRGLGVDRFSASVGQRAKGPPSRVYDSFSDVTE